MNFGLTEDVARSRVAEHERQVARLLLVREAKAAAAEAPAGPPRTHVRGLPWHNAWRPWRLAN